MSHNSKAVYQRYMGWYDANPANLNPHPPEAESARYVAAMGGADQVLTGARTAITEGDYRWAATLLNHLVFSGGEQNTARTLLAEVYTQLGYQSEAGTWRNIYLTGAQELTEGVMAGPINSFSPDVLAATPTSMLLDFVAVRIDPTRLPDKPVQVRIILTDRNEAHLLTLDNGVLVHEAGVEDPATATLTMARPTLLMTLFAGAPTAPLIARGDIKVEGDPGAYTTLLQALGTLDPGFNIVTP
jgi:alkyl sulfatase BDS1-like metallo-beta-lactamase superfamily hydrolase